MTTYIAYLRVSTSRQGEEGVSLLEQKRLIREHATKHKLHITTWFEEQESAAKRGRPIFTNLVIRLKRMKNTKLIITKLIGVYETS